MMCNGKGSMTVGPELSLCRLRHEFLQRAWSEGSTQPMARPEHCASMGPGTWKKGTSTALRYDYLHKYVYILYIYIVCWN